MKSISDLHAPPDSARPARRSAARFAVALGSVALVVMSGVVTAGDVDDAARVEMPAVRIDGRVETSPGVPAGNSVGGSAAPFSGSYLYPVETQPRCENLDNYGGNSKAFGAGGHQGVDIGTEEGQKVYAVTDGVLYRQWTNLSSAPGLGWGLLGDDDAKFRYYHLAGFAPGLEVGSIVERGQVIGYVGDTGNASPGGWHLHFEIRPGPAPHARTVDPNPLLDIPDDCIVYWR